MVVCVGLLLSICLYSNCQKTRMYSYNILCRKRTWCIIVANYESSEIFFVYYAPLFLKLYLDRLKNFILFHH